MSETQRVAIVTGAAGGIGRAMTKGLLTAGIRVASVVTTVVSGIPYLVLRDVVGLYLDEKSQIQALERTQPMLPWASVTLKVLLTIRREGRGGKQPAVGADSTRFSGGAGTGRKPLAPVSRGVSSRRCSTW